MEHLTSTGVGYRRTKLAALACGLVLALTAVTVGQGPAAPAGASTTPGSGSAFAGTIKIDPRAGNLSIGIDEGKSTATHQNTAAQAISQAIDLGSIGTSLASYGCDGSNPTLEQSAQPGPLIADTRDTTRPPSSQEYESTIPGNTFYKQVEVTADPFAKATTTTAPLVLNGLLSLGGGSSTASSGLVDGVRVAEASADISSIDLAGVVKLAGLHWSARSEDGKDPVGTFSIGSASIAGTAVPTDDPAATLGQLNAALDPLGLHLTPPTSHVDQGVLFVDPLAISVVQNATRDKITGSIISGIQPIRGAAFDAVLKAYCKASTEITVLDIAIGSITGAGSLNLLLGGAQATQGLTATNGFNLGFGGGAGTGAASLPATGTSTLGSSSTPSISTGPSLGSGTVSPPVAPTNRNPGTGGNQSAAAAVPAAVVKGSRGGALAGVGLLSLALLGLMAEADRRKMRRAQREIAI